MIRRDAYPVGPSLGSLSFAGLRRFRPSLPHFSQPVWPTKLQWLLFAAQAVLVAMVESGEDIFRGNIVPPNAGEAMHNARQLAGFESAHGLFIEPAIQTFFQHAQTGLISWAAVVRFTNGVYAFGHLFITLLVATWVFVCHRKHFPLVRNVMFLTNVLALIGYELYPMAPPRLTTGLVFNGHAFRFQDTMQHVLGSGKLNGTPVGYNPFSAMPSLHVAWALIMGITLVVLARHPLLKLLGAIYPAVMTFTVIVTANHYVMDAIGASIAVGLATVILVAFSYARRGLHHLPVAPRLIRRPGLPCAYHGIAE